MELPEAPALTDHQQFTWDALQTLVGYQKSMIERQLQCVTHQNKPLPLSTSLLLSEYPRSSEHPAPSKHSLPSTPSSTPSEYSRLPSVSLFLKIYKELDRLLNQLRDWEDFFQKCLSDYMRTGDAYYVYSTDIMKEVRENQKGVQNLIDESFKHGCFESSFPIKVGRIRLLSHYRHALISQSFSERREQLKMDIELVNKEKLLRITDHFLSYKRVLSGFLSTLQPIVKELEQKQTELKMVTPAHVMAAEGMEIMQRAMEMMDREMEIMEMEMEKEIEGMMMEMLEMETSMKTITPGKVSMVHHGQSKEQLGKSKKLADVDVLDSVYLISGHHAVTWEQIRTLCFLPLWFVNREKLSESEKRCLDSLERDLTKNIADLDLTLNDLIV